MKRKGITGKLFIREGGDYEGERLVVVCGVLSFPPDCLKGEHLYLTVGQDMGDHVALNIMANHRENIRPISIGNTPSGLLCEPIWQV